MYLRAVNRLPNWLLVNMPLRIQSIIVKPKELFINFKINSTRLFKKILYNVLLFLESKSPIHSCPKKKNHQYIESTRNPNFIPPSFLQVPRRIYMVQRTKMLTEENPEAFASPEQKPEDGSKNKKRKKKKKNNEDSAQPNQLPQPQVCSEPLVVVTPNPEIKSNEESSLPKKKRQHKKKNSINAEVAQPNREEPKPSFNLEIKKEAEPVGVSVEGAETITGKEHKSEIGKLDEVVIVENAVKHDQDHYQEQLHTVDTEKKTGKLKRKRDKSELYGSQSNEPGETVVQTSIIDREVPPVDQTIPGNSCPVNLSELENEYLDKIWMERKRVEAGSIAERFEGNNRVKVTNAPHYQHGRSSMVRNMILGFNFSSCIFCSSTLG